MFSGSSFFYKHKVPVGAYLSDSAHRVVVALYFYFHQLHRWLLVFNHFLVLLYEEQF